MVQAAQHRNGDKLALARRRLGPRCFSGKSLMRASDVIVVLDELPQEPLQVSVVQHGDVIQELLPEGPDEALGVRILPGTPVGVSQGVSSMLKYRAACVNSVSRGTPKNADALHP